MKPANEIWSQPVKMIQGDGAQYPKTKCYILFQALRRWKFDRKPAIERWPKVVVSQYPK